MTRGFFACSGHAVCTRGVNTSNRNKGEGLLELDHRAGAIPLEIYGSSNKTTFFPENAFSFFFFCFEQCGWSWVMAIHL